MSENKNTNVMKKEILKERNMKRKKHGKKEKGGR
jgi:hypothetical protein